LTIAARLVVCSHPNPLPEGEGTRGSGSAGALGGPGERGWLSNPLLGTGHPRPVGYVGTKNPCNRLKRGVHPTRQK
jgi:hypothetical protein